MRIKAFSTLAAVAFILAGCEPAGTEIASGNSTVDDRIWYKITVLDEPKDVENFRATHVLHAKIVKVRSDFAARIDYYGYPDGVTEELADVMDGICKSAGKRRLNDVHEDVNLETKRSSVFFNCA